MKRLLHLSFVFAGLFFAAGGDSNDPVGGDTEMISVEDFRFNPNSTTAELNGNVVSQQFTVPDITLDVVEYGAVMAYFREQDTWTAMPYTYGVESADIPAVDYSVSIGYAFEHRLLEVFYEVSSAEAVDPRDLPATDIKVVIFRNLAAAKNGPDLTNYEEVARYYGLED